MNALRDNHFFSPLENEQGGTKQQKCFKFSPTTEENSESCTTTPRRKLCLDSLDDSLQSPTESTDSAYSENSNDFLMMTDDSTSSPIITDLQTPNETSTTNGKHQQLYARRHKTGQRLSLILPGKENQMPLLPTDGVPSRPHLSSLPSSPLATDFRVSKSLIKQISSPLERMTLASPAPISTTSDSTHSDGYFSEVFENMEDENSNSSMPDSFTKLFTTPINELWSTNTTNDKNNSGTPVKSGRLRHNSLCLRGSLKRPTPTRELSEEKAAKRPSLQFSSPSPSPPKRHLKGTTLFRSQSVSVHHCENAIFPASPGDGGVERIGDHSKPYILPLANDSTCVTDLKNISSETLSRLLKGEYHDIINEYTIVDCRYPYEYQGGHIQNAINIWEKEVLLQSYFTSPTHPDEDKRSIIIFHCEFSSKRGPEMSRFMRQKDRECNGMEFPKLYYPELYLLQGGYKKFYEEYSELCVPQSYRRMLDEEHKEDLRHFSKRSKSWNGGDTATYHRKRQPLLRHRHSAHDASMMGSNSSW